MWRKCVSKKHFNPQYIYDLISVHVSLLINPAQHHEREEHSVGVAISFSKISHTCICEMPDWSGGTVLGPGGEDIGIEPRYSRLNRTSNLHASAPVATLPGHTFALGLVSLVSVYCSRMRYQLWSVTFISVSQCVQLFKQVHPRESLDVSGMLSTEKTPAVNEKNYLIWNFIHLMLCILQVNDTYAYTPFDKGSLCWAVSSTLNRNVFLLL